MDNDSDGMPDAWELLHGLDPRRQDSGDDFDEDGVTNLEEYISGTNPILDDTDSDGMPDGWEMQNELNPLAADSLDDPDDDE